MRSPFGLIGLVLVLLLVGLLAKQALRRPQAPPAAPGADPPASASLPQDAQLRSAQVQQQVQKGLDDAAENARRQREAADQ